MSEQDQAPGAKQPKKGPNCYVSPLQQEGVTLAAKALRSLFPPGTSQAVVSDFFQHRVSSAAFRMWRNGHRNPPQWALELLARHADELAQCARQAKAGDPQKAGQLALHEWRKKRRALGT